MDCVMDAIEDMAGELHQTTLDHYVILLPATSGAMTPGIIEDTDNEPGHEIIEILDDDLMVIEIEDDEDDEPSFPFEGSSRMPIDVDAADPPEDRVPDTQRMEEHCGDEELGIGIYPADNYIFHCCICFNTLTNPIDYALKLKLFDVIRTGHVEAPARVPADVPYNWAEFWF
ncbi:hypothetical protein B0H10DRAFT_1951690 [Mycena sp. CBHHK59/15]|nr:hypothetical protein B0H10DRAFT_1951690 [Mycena sp. CBHHK59/15]